MARCQCAGTGCGCAVTSGSGVTVAGTGSASNPYAVSLDMNYYNLEGTYVGPSFKIGDGSTPVEAGATFEFDFNPGANFNVLLPDGSVTQPWPLPGAVINVFMGGVSGNFTGFAGPQITWFGQALPAGADKRGWYRFVFLADRFAGQFIGVSFVP